MQIHEVETLVIGSGIVGSSVAWHLARLGMTGVRVIDFDLEGTLSSSELNVGGVRATFNQQINIDLSKNSIEFFSTVADQIGYRACGYLWLHRPEGLAFAMKAREAQIARNWPVEAWDVAKIRSKIPFIDKTEDLAGAVFAPRDGLLNPNTLKNYYRQSAKLLGVQFDDRRRAVEARPDGNAVKVVCEFFHSPLEESSKLQVLAEEPQVQLFKEKADHKMALTLGAADTIVYRAQRVINCAGAWAPLVAKLFQSLCPSKPVRRQVCIFDCREVDLTQYGMIVDPSGVYFHPEATNGLAGRATPEEPGFSFKYDGESFFQEEIWPALYERSSLFERLRHITGWGGLYEVSPDDSAILGAAQTVEKAFRGRVYEAHSFSGHGVMQSYAAGLALAERLVLGRYETVDASQLEVTRFAAGRLILESAVI